MFHCRELEAIQSLDGQRSECEEDPYVSLDSSQSRACDKDCEQIVYLRSEPRDQQLESKGKKNSQPR